MRIYFWFIMFQKIPTTKKKSGRIELFGTKDEELRTMTLFVQSLEAMVHTGQVRAGRASWLLMATSSWKGGSSRGPPSRGTKRCRVFPAACNLASGLQIQTPELLPVHSYMSFSQHGALWLPLASPQYY